MKKPVVLLSVFGAAAAIGLATLPAQAGEGDHKRHKRGASFEAADTNGDGVLSAQEQAAAKEAAFDKADMDGDGYLTEADREARRAEHQAKREEYRAKRREHRALKRERHATRRAERRTEVDTDSDGKISRAEFMAAEGRLKSVDADGDGNITKEEADAAREQMRAKMLERRAEYKAAREAEEATASETQE